MDPQLIDFNARFTQDYFAWCKKHPEIAKDEEKMNDLFFDMYDAWLDQPKKWLGNRSPNQYFDEIQDPQMIVSMLIEYVRAEIELPDPFMRSILEHKEEVYPILYHILLTDDAEEITSEELLNLQGHIISIITEMQMKHPYERYIAKLRELNEDSLFAEEATTALEEAGSEIKELLLEAYPSCQGYARLCVLDLLSECGPDAKIFEILMDEFTRPDADRAFLSECIARFADPGAMPYLKKALDNPELEYSIFREIKNAIEAISGEEIEERDFAGDQLYDFLASQDEDEK